MKAKTSSAGTLQHVPNVLVLQEASVKAGRNKIRGIFEYARLYGPWNLFLLHGREGEQTPRDLIGGGTYAGAIVGQMSQKHLPFLKSLHKPLILMDPLRGTLAEHPFLARCPRVTAEADSIAELAVRHFVGLGISNLAFVNEHLMRDWSTDRAAAFARCAAARRLACQIYSPDETARAALPLLDTVHLKAWLKALPKPVGILAAMDTRAVQLIRLCQELGFHVPADVAVLGVDDDELLCEGTLPACSSIRMDTEHAGFLAAQTLDRILRQGTRNIPEIHYGALEVVARESTRIRDRYPDATAVRVYQFIHLNAREPIRVVDIAKRLSLSVRTAQMHFLDAYRVTISDELRRARLALAERELRETGLTIADIAERCGFGTEIQLRRIFRRAHPCTMRQWRQKAPEGLQPRAGAPRSREVTR